MPIEFFGRFLRSVDWTTVALIAGSIGAVALSWSRLLDLIDLWLLKVIHSGNRGYVLIFGIAVRWWWFGKGWRLIVLPPFVYPQLIFLFQVREFSIIQRSLPVGEQAIDNLATGKKIRVGGNVIVRFAKDGMNAKKSQILTNGPDAVALTHIQGVIASTIEEADTTLLTDREALNSLIHEGCKSLTQSCGVVVDRYWTTTLVPLGEQLQKDGMVAIAESANG